MGDRNNPIKFGPEWLRNLAPEHTAGRSNNNRNNTRPGITQSNRSTGSQAPGGSSQGSTGVAVSSNASGATMSASSLRSAGAAAQGSASGIGAAAIGGPNLPSTSSGINTRNSSATKVLLAKLRYGREEMLALCDTDSEASEELKNFDILYQPRPKPPNALNTFEEETRDNSRGGPPIGAMTSGERFGVGKQSGRGAIASEVRAKPRMPFVRHPSTQAIGRGRVTPSSNTRMAFGNGDEESAPGGGPRSSWNASNGGPGPSRPTTDQADWNKMFRSRRQANNTNWRQQTSRDEDEWRSSEHPRSRPNADKWDRDWNERTGQDRPQSWNPNRRTWVGGENQNNEDNLPEWAVDNAEAGAGTFDSSGAFHGFSNDDSNIPKPQETTYPLIRSHTHGSFARAKNVETGSDEWWASEKAKKLSPIRFEAGEPKYKKSLSTGSSDAAKLASASKVNMSDLQEIPEKLEKSVNQEKTLNNIDEKKSVNQNFPDKASNVFSGNALMRSDQAYNESGNEQSNFQSVIIASNNNGLRQKHQNIVCSSNEPVNRSLSCSAMPIHGLHGMPLQSQHTEQRVSSTTEEQMVDSIIEMSLDDTNINHSKLQSHNPPTSSAGLMSLQNPNLQRRITSPAIPVHGLTLTTNTLPPSMQGPSIQNVGITNSALNSSLGLPIGPTNNGMVMPLQEIPVMQNSQINNPMGTVMQSRTVMGFQNTQIPVMPNQNVGASSLFLGQNNAQQISTPNDIPMSNHGPQNNMFPMHGLQHSNSQVAFASMYNNMMSAVPPQTPTNNNNPAEQWYYEDPKKVIQGPFSSKDMYSWFGAGFFSPSLMVRRACDTHMRPLGSYGPLVPFAQLDMLSPFPISGFESRPQGAHDLLNQQPGLGIEDSLWSQPRSTQDLMWMQQAINNRNESGVNNLPMFFWDPQPTSAISSNSLLPEEIVKEMKTEDQILAQLRATQNIPPIPQPSPFLNDTYATNSTSISHPDDNFPTIKTLKAPDLEELQKLIPNETLTISAAPAVEPKIDVEVIEAKTEKTTKAEAVPSVTETSNTKSSQQLQSKVVSDTKSTKQTKNDSDKAIKIKDFNTKTKNKKAKEEKKEDAIDGKSKEEDIVNKEKRSLESSPTKSKKEDKINKKDIEKEKKEWIKEGFTIVKGTEKKENTSKESKKKAEDAKVVEESERKRKEEEKIVADEERKKRILEAEKKQQDMIQQKQATESLIRKAPWSAVATQSVTTIKNGPTLAEIQRLEREKKLEQIKEQQHMMQIIAQQQAATLAREQEVQAGLGWAKKKSNSSASQSLAEIQAEARRQSAAAAVAAAAAQAIEDAQALAATQPPPAHVPWGSSHNGGGFWDTQSNPSSKPEKAKEPAKAAEPVKHKKKTTLTVNTKKEMTPIAEFESWCATVLTSWSTKIDVPTFVGFLKDIESPYEVKDYVKCYLGETKDSSDFARQFLEKRSKLLRVGMVTPSDDLCSPALAINPRSTSLSDYQEVKGKGKKMKKNKMLKVDARILGFSVTAAEDRINVGDIDTV